MEMSRAHQIVSSSKKIDVFYKGSSVWIESLNDSDESADVTNMETHQRVKVPVSLLFELP